MNPESAPDQRSDDALYYRSVLHDFIDMGADLARLILGQAKAAVQAGEQAPDPTIAFDRIARTVRRSIALAHKLAEPAPDPARPRTAARKRILREVEDAIQRDAEDTEAETLHEELLERLDSPDLDDEIDDRPVPEIIADICRDLGIAATPGTHPWRRRTPADVAALCARAAKPRAARRTPPQGWGFSPEAQSAPAAGYPGAALPGAG